MKTFKRGDVIHDPNNSQVYLVYNCFNNNFGAYNWYRFNNERGDMRPTYVSNGYLTVKSEVKNCIVLYNISEVMQDEN